MAGIREGKRVRYEYETGRFVPGFVVEYAAGKDEGDHLICGFSNSDQRAAGEGDTYAKWSVLGEGQGTFRL